MFDDEVELSHSPWGRVLILPDHKVRQRSASRLGPMEIWRDRSMSVVSGDRVWRPSQGEARALLGDSEHILMLRRLIEGSRFGFGLAPCHAVLEQALMDRFVIVRVEDNRGHWNGPAVQRDNPKSAERDDLGPELLHMPVATDWIEIELFDEKGDPISGVRYLIVSPDGCEHRGRTDSLGLARMRRIPSGECMVSFLPENDAWRVNRLK